jgi:hypothetical protein
MLRVIFWSCLGGGLALSAALGCGGSAALRAAEAGRLVELRAALADELARGALDDEEARGIARAVAEGEILRARPPSGEARLMELRRCARHLEPALRERAAGADAIAPVAAMILLDAGLSDMKEAQEHAARMARAAEPDVAAAFRAVHARTLVGPGDGPARRKRLLDGDQAVRVAALRAAIVAADPHDREAVLDAARLDPYPLARTLAIRAAAQGGEAVALALRDVWVLADEPSREAIAETWASPRMMDAGGRKQLLWVIATQRGAPGIAAARALAHAGGAGAADAIGVLVHAIEEGTTNDRIYAIHAVPFEDASARAALARAKDDPDEAVAVAALSRQVEALPLSSTDRTAAAARLLKLAAGTTTRAILAKDVLARAGFRQITAILLRDAASTDDRLRGAAAEGLIALGERPRAARLLADPEPHVRAAAACAMLSGP